MDSRMKLLKMFESERIGVWEDLGEIKKHSVRILYIRDSYGMGIKRSYIFSSGRMMFRLFHLLIRFLLQAVCL